MVSPLLFTVVPCAADPPDEDERLDGSPLGSCTGGDPPTCCQPATTPEARAEQDWRLRAMADALAARTPRCCPACGSRQIAPVFWPDASLDVMDCADCTAIFSGRGD